MNLKTESLLKKENRLGKGLDSLISVPKGSARVLSIDIDKIFPNPNQPRKKFETKSLDELATSIKAHGVLQPILVKSSGDGYQIIAGERRWRASQKAGLHKIPAIAKAPKVDEEPLWALLENLQRKDLNPVEEAEAYQVILSNNPNFTQESLAEALGKSRSSLANVLRLLKLEAPIQEWISEGRISLGQAKELLSLKDSKSRIQTAKTLLDNKVSVKTLSRRIKKPKKQALWLQGAREQLEKKFGLEVQIDLNKEKGKVSFLFSSENDLKRLLNSL